MRRFWRKRKNNRKGVTLFEVMIALALFAIIIVPVMRSFVTAMTVNKRSREVMVATDVAQIVMEGITGKTYQEVVYALGICNAEGFKFETADDRKNSGKYALTTINNGFYNSGLRVLPVDIPGAVDVDDNNGWAESMTDTEFTKAVVADAVNNMITVRLEAEDPLNPNLDSWDGNKANTENKISSDKILYYGFSSNTYAPEADGTTIPKAAYMLYSRVQKDNHFYDVAVTLTPTAQNKIMREDDDPDTTRDIYFTYKVVVSVYEYNYDDYDKDTKDWPSRYEGGTLEGAPIAVLTSGIQYK